MPADGGVDPPVVVPETLAGERVDRAVSLLTGWTRSEVRALVEAGAVLVNGRPVARSAKLHRGDRLDWTEAPEQAGPPAADPGVPVTVVYEDEDLVVVDKPPGLVVHPGSGHRDGTLVNGLLARYDLTGVGEAGRPGIVHRLDRETSGLLVVARTPRAYDALVGMLAAHDVEREYVAVVVGIVEAATGTIDAPIGRSPRTPTKMAVRTGGRYARTHYDVVERFEDTTLLEVRLETGRTHQIRVHLAAIGHPVLGDPLYGRADPRCARPFLHAAALAFAHPVTGVPMRFTSPLPPDLQATLARLDPSD